MASTNESSVERVIDGVRSTVNTIISVLDPVLQPLRLAGGFIFSSFFRFLIFLGVVLAAIGVAFYDGHVAGHLGIYGGTAILIGIVGRLIIHWKVSDSA